MRFRAKLVIYLEAMFRALLVIVVLTPLALVAGVYPMPFPDRFANGAPRPLTAALF